MAVVTDWLPGWLRRGTERLLDSAQDESQVASTTGGDLGQEPVVVWEAANLLEAQVVKGRLESAGIPAIIRSEALGAIYGLTTGELAAADVLAPAQLAEKALTLLFDGEEELDGALVDEPPVERQEE
jgi:hypothetical protein